MEEAKKKNFQENQNLLSTITSTKKECIRTYGFAANPEK
jgi:hypothetical protein